MAIKTSIGKVRFAKAHLSEPNPEFGRYEITCLLSKDNKEMYGALKNAFESAVNEGKRKHIISEYSGFNVSEVLKDGDRDFLSDDYKGCWYFTARSQYQPLVTDSVYGFTTSCTAEAVNGGRGFVMLNLYPYCYGGLEGVGVGVNRITIEPDVNDYKFESNCTGWPVPETI